MSVLQGILGFICGDFDAEKPNSLTRLYCLLYFGFISLYFPVFTAYFNPESTVRPLLAFHYPTLSRTRVRKINHPAAFKQRAHSANVLRSNAKTGGAKAFFQRPHFNFEIPIFSVPKKWEEKKGLGVVRSMADARLVKLGKPRGHFLVFDCIWEFELNWNWRIGTLNCVVCLLAAMEKDCRRFEGSDGFACEEKKKGRSDWIDCFLFAFISFV